MNPSYTTNPTLAVNLFYTFFTTEVLSKAACTSCLLPLFPFSPTFASSRFLSKNNPVTLLLLRSAMTPKFLILISIFRLHLTQYIISRILFFFFQLLELHPWHMEVPGLGVEYELPLLAYTQPQQCQIRASSATYTTAQGNARCLTH